MGELHPEGDFEIILGYREPFPYFRLDRVQHPAERRNHARWVRTHRGVLVLKGKVIFKNEHQSFRGESSLWHQHVRKVLILPLLWLWILIVSNLNLYLCSGYWWSDSGTMNSTASVFLCLGREKGHSAIWQSKALQQLFLPSTGNRNIFSCWNICPINFIFSFLFSFSSYGLSTSLQEVYIPLTLGRGLPCQAPGSVQNTRRLSRSITRQLQVTAEEAGNTQAVPIKYSGTCVFIFI